MPHPLAEVLPVLEPVEDRGLLPDRAARAHGVVPDDHGEGESNGELDRLRAGLSPDDDQERRDKRRMRTRHPAGTEDAVVPIARADSLRDDLRQLTQEADDERNQEGVEAEEGHGRRV